MYVYVIRMEKGWDVFMLQVNAAACDLKTIEKVSPKYKKEIKSNLPVQQN